MKNKLVAVKQRTIYWANLNPTKGSEQAGKRPVVVISGTTMNEHLPVCIVCPLSSQIKYPDTCTTLIKSTTNKLKYDSEIITFQVRTISSDRLEEEIGSITPAELKDVIQKIGHLLHY